MQVMDLGRMEYRAAWEAQLEVHARVVAGADDTLLLVEHDPVLTLGANFHAENLLHPVATYEARGIGVVTTDRGGDVTYHGPGQLTIYPIFNLESRGKDLHRWLRDLEETQLHTLCQFGIEGRRFAPYTGAWVADQKISAIGIKVKKWVSLHGIALNVHPDLSIYREFIPCGIQHFGVTSLESHLGRPVSLEEAKAATVRAFFDVFANAATDSTAK